jgi:hypothetical protein
MLPLSLSLSLSPYDSMRIGFLSMHQYNLYLKETKKMSYVFNQKRALGICLFERKNKLLSATATMQKHMTRN